MTIFGKVLLGLILVTAAVLVIKGPSKSGVEVTNENADDATAEENTTVEAEGSFNGSVKDLMARGGNYKCTFTQQVENSTSTGTIYVSDKKMRGDFESNVSAGGTNTTIKSHMISDGSYFYTWSDAMPGSGFKMAIDTSAQTNGGTSQGFDTGVTLTYDCSKALNDDSQFNLPTSVTFQDMSTFKVGQ